MPASSLSRGWAGLDVPDLHRLVDLPRLISAYYTVHPDPGDAAQRVAFGTSGHRGSAFAAAFNEDHILAITQAIVEYRAGKGYGGPLFLAMDTHGASERDDESATATPHSDLDGGGGTP